MFAATSPIWRVLVELLAGIAAGIANGIAGGGTFLAFPSLLAVGIPSLAANVSTCVGLTPSYIGGISGYRKEITQQRALLRTLGPACVLGAVTGCLLLVSFPSATFRSILPWLIASGTALFAAAPLITRRIAHIDSNHPARRISLVTGTVLIAIYGGYFGAGMGILLMALMAVTLPFEIATMQGLRNILSTFINVAAAIVFLLGGHVALHAALGLFAGCLLGGIIGTKLLKRLSPNSVRVIVILFGVATSIRLFW
jgi:hypothetical protein